MKKFVVLIALIIPLYGISGIQTITECDFTNQTYIFQLNEFGKYLTIRATDIKTIEHDGFRLIITNNYNQRIEFRIKRTRSCDFLFRKRDYFRDPTYPRLRRNP